MVLELGSIKYDVSETKKVSTGLTTCKIVDRSPEEKFLLSHLAPACHGKFLTNEYRLVAEVHYDGCCICKSDKSISSVPLTIIPLNDPSL